MEGGKPTVSQLIRFSLSGPLTSAMYLLEAAVLRPHWPRLFTSGQCGEGSGLPRTGTGPLQVPGKPGDAMVRAGREGLLGWLMETILLT